MTVNVSNLTITTPVATSSTNHVALELSGAEAIAQLPSIVTVLSDGSVQFSAPTKGASSKSTRPHAVRVERAGVLGSGKRGRAHQHAGNDAHKGQLSEEGGDLAVAREGRRQSTGEGLLEQREHHPRVPADVQSGHPQSTRRCSKACPSVQSSKSLSACWPRALDRDS